MASSQRVREGVKEGQTQRKRERDTTAKKVLSERESVCVCERERERVSKKVRK